MDWKKAHANGTKHGDKAEKGGKVRIKGGKTMKRGFRAMVKRHLKKAQEEASNEGSNG